MTSRIMWNKLQLGVATSPFRSLFFKKPDFDKTWETQLCIVQSPVKPWFLDNLDGALRTAKTLVLQERGYGPTSSTDGIRRTLKCRIELVQWDTLYTIGKFSLRDKNKEVRQSVTIKGWKNTRILTSKFIPEWVAHELLHWAEWFYNLPSDEKFCYENEKFLLKILNS